MVPYEKRFQHFLKMKVFVHKTQAKFEPHSTAEPACDPGYDFHAKHQDNEKVVNRRRIGPEYTEMYSPALPEVVWVCGDTV